MKPKLTIAALVIAGLLLIKFMAAAQQHPTRNAQGMQSMPGMDMDREATSSTPGEQEMNAATHLMKSRHMDMGPHMKMTELRPARPEDQERANRVIESAKEAMQKYQDHHAALNDGYRIFLPNVPQHQYHFTNYWYGFEAAFRFNPTHPTSLLYDKTADGYKLAGVMYTAPASANEEELNDRIPLSVAQWHEHVNFCFPPKERQSEMWQKTPKFGMAGSIATKEECDAAGGKFVPRLFGWMIHLYPNEKSAEAIWALGQEHDKMEMH